jgi:carbonic anhydrase
VTENASVTDAAIRQEQGGATSFACWQALRHKFQIGAHGERETPVPIPNTEVKPLIGYNTWVLALGK